MMLAVSKLNIYHRLTRSFQNFEESYSVAISIYALCLISNFVNGSVYLNWTAVRWRFTKGWLNLLNFFHYFV